MRLPAVHRVISLSLVSAAVVGCSNLPPASSSYSLQRFAVPEVASKSYEVDVHIGTAEMHKVSLPSTQNGKPTFDCIELLDCHENDATFVQAGVSIVPGLAFSYDNQLDRVGVIWQFAGAHLGDSKTGNFSQALVFGASGHSDLAWANQYESNLGIDTLVRTDSWNQHTKAYDIGWVGGYRLNDDWLIYGGPFYTLHKIDLESRSEIYNVTPNVTVVGFYDFEGKQLGANIAAQYRFFDVMELNIELVSARYKLNSGSQTDTQLNLMLGARF